MSDVKNPVWEHGGYHLRGDPWAEERFRQLPVVMVK
jgi:hypothetical protein